MSAARPAPSAQGGSLRARYDDARVPAPSRAEVDWLADRLPRDAGPVLDAICGSGRRLVALAARGIAIHGADASAASLALAQAHLDAAGLAATLYRQGLAALNLPMRYAAAILDGAAFARIVDPFAAREALARLRAHLVAPGILLVDAPLPVYARTRPGAPFVELTSVVLPDGSQIRLRAETSVDADAKLARTEARYTHRLGARSLGEEHARGAITWRDADEWRALLEDAGFREIAATTSPREQGAGNDADLALVARA